MRKVVQGQPQPVFRKNFTISGIVLVLIFAAILFAPCSSWGQSASGTISGTVTDTTGAVVPKATAVLEDVISGVKTATVSNGAGFFNFAAVAPSTYKLTVEAAGFTRWVATDIVEHQGESHNIPKIALPMGSTNSSVEVTSSEAGAIPLDNGSSTMTLNNEMVDTLSIQGRDAAELVKFMPGMAMNSGLGQTEFNSQTTSTNSGPIGQFSANGTQPYGSMQMTLDGAGLIDVGNMGTQIANVNQDTTAEFTYLNAAFGADTPRGPSIIQIVSKSGGQRYHGDVYTYLRNWQFNANDPYLKAQGIEDRTISHQVYPGATIGGPVPLFGYNRHNDKLFFFAGFEKMYQNPSATLHQFVMPTANMLTGDFSSATLPGDQNPNSTWWPTAQVPCANAASWTSFCPSGGANQGLFANGQIPKAYWDPDGLALLTYLNKYDTPNVDPATHNGYNYQFLDHPPVNRWELRLRGDWDPTEKDKISVVFTKQNEADVNNFGIWWQPSDTAPLASQIKAQTLAKLWTANYVRILSPTTTNEFSFAYSYFTFPPAFANPNAMTASAAGYTTYSPFNTTGIDAFDQLPNLISWGSEVGNNGSFGGIYTPAMVKGFNNSFGNIKQTYSFQDNLTKVIGKHSFKAGFFWDDNDQTQTTNSGNWSQGAIEFDQWSTYTTNNPYADMLIGATDGMSQYAAAPVHDVAFHEWAFYGQDQWHVSRKFTLDAGVRFDHEGQWAPVSGPGFAVFDPSTYDNTANAAAYTGMKWHQTDSKIPQSGFSSAFVAPDVRVGGAFDFYGNGTTVFRAGFGMYRWQASEGDVDGALTPSYNVQNISTPSTAPAYWWKQQGNTTPGGYAQLATFAPSTSGSWCANNATCPSASALELGNGKTPLTFNWDAMVDQQLPSRLVFELQYIGNRTTNVPFTNNSTSNEASFSNVNKIPVGGLFGTDAITGVNYWQTSCAAGSCATPNSSYYSGYRPYRNYGVLNVVRRGGYSNYNGMVVALQKQTGAQTFLLNYTFSKVMGIRDGNTENGGGDGPTINPFSVQDNYGPLAYDRTHLFNAAYKVNLPGIHGSNFLVRGVTNGWQLSGDTQFQSGAPLQPNTGGSMNVTWESGANGATANNTYVMGTNAVILVPYLTCDPRSGSGKYFNVNCFQTPTTQGVNGPSIWPYIKGPAFFVSDLAMMKNFKLRDSQSIQFRVSAFNFLNHPLDQLGEGSDASLHMACNSSSTALGCNLGGGNVNTYTNGSAQYKALQQNRLMELALKYYF
jgi:hypothetical protein